MRAPVPSAAEEAARGVAAAQERQRAAVEEILATRKKRWEASESGIKAKAEILRREAEAAKAREGVR